MPEEQGHIEADVVDNNTPDDAVVDRATRDQERIEEWHAANSEAPSKADVNRAAKDVREAEKMLAQARKDYQAKAAHRATLHGWVSVANETGESAKILHAWHREHVGHLPDLSTIPEKEMKREAKRVEAEERQIATIDKLRQSVEERKARLSAGTIENGEQA